MIGIYGDRLGATSARRFLILFYVSARVPLRGRSPRPDSRSNGRRATAGAIQMRCGDETAHCNAAATRRPFLSVSDQHHRRYLPRRSRRRIDPSNQSDLTARAPISSQSMEYQAPTRYTPNDLSLADDSDHSGRRCVSHIPEHAALIRPDAVPIYSPNQTDGTAVFEPSIGQALGEDR
jgi:hypothetical protein